MRKLATLFVPLFTASVFASGNPTCTLTVPTWGGQVPGNNTLIGSLAWAGVPLSDLNTRDIDCYVSIELQRANGTWIYGDAVASNHFNSDQGKWYWSLFCPAPPDNQASCQGKVTGWYTYRTPSGGQGYAADVFYFFVLAP